MVRVRLTPAALRVEVTEAAGAHGVRLECWGGSRKRQLLEKVLGVPVVVVAPDGTEVRSDDDGDGD
jgi:hypothetical protein